MNDALCVGAEEALHHLSLAGELRTHDLHRDALCEVHVGGGQDHAHPSGAEHTLDPALAVEDLSWGGHASQIRSIER